MKIIYFSIDERIKEKKRPENFINARATWGRDTRTTGKRITRRSERSYYNE